MTHNWEHLVKQVDETAIQRFLSEIEQIGWELVAVTQNGATFTLFLRRPVSEYI